jgi:alkaline phosphatase
MQQFLLKVHSSKNKVAVMEKFCLIFLIATIFATSAHEQVEEVSQNVQWDADDSRWEDLPNRWDHANFVPPVAPVIERTKEFWVNQGQNVLNEKVNSKLNLNKAKNLIIFIGDGMGISTQMAARAYKGDERNELSFEKFPFSGLSKTYCINYQVPDSACTATAIFSGIKNNHNVLSLSGEVDIRNCTAQRDNSTHIDTIFKYAQDNGRSTGFVTTTRITHATPAATYARAAFREWESNANTPEGCEDIAHQLIHGEVGSKLDVAMGGGRGHFIPNTVVADNQRGYRTDNRNLINEFNLIQRIKGTRSAFVQNRVR